MQAEFYRLKARAWQSNRSNAGAEAECLLDRAITISPTKAARQLQLRAARDFAELWRDQGKHAEARNLLAGLYGLFTEGFDSDSTKSKVWMALRIRVNLAEESQAKPSGSASGRGPRQA